MATTLSVAIQQASQSVPGNYSNDNFQVYAHSTSGSFNNNAQPGYIDFNGQRYYFNHGYSANTTTLLFSGSAAVPHNPDGTKTTYASASYTTGTGSGTIYASNQLTQTPIPRASVLSKPPDFNLGTPFNLTITKYDASFTDNLVIKVGTTTIRSVSNISTGYTVNFTTGELNTIYGLIPNSPTVTISYELTTVGKGTSTQTNVGTVVNANPIFSAFVYAENDSTINALTGGLKFIKGYSDIKVTIANGNLATGQNSATISKYVFTNGGQTQEVSATSSNVLTINNVLESQINVRVYDSRNNYTDVSYNLSSLGKWVDYKIPSALTATLERTNGVDTTAQLKLSANYDTADLGSVVNTITACDIRYKLVTEPTTWSAWTSILAQVQYSAGTINNKATPDNILPITFDLLEYDIEIRIKDRIEYASRLSVLSDGKVAYDVYKNGNGEYHWGFNGMANGDTVTVNGDMGVTGDVNILGILTSNLPSLKEPSGYTKLSNGIILQWGTFTGSGTTNFPIEFPNACLIVMCDGDWVLNSNPIYKTLSAATGWSTTSFTRGSFGYMTVGNQGESITTQSYRGFQTIANFGGPSKWFAVGY